MGLYMEGLYTGGLIYRRAFIQEGLYTGSRAYIRTTFDVMVIVPVSYTMNEKKCKLHTVHNTCM
jgi:hypothetical protein